MSLILPKVNTKPQTATDTGSSQKELMIKTSFLNKRQLTETHIYNLVEHLQGSYFATIVNGF